MATEANNKFKEKKECYLEAPNYTIFWTFAFISASLASYYVYSSRNSSAKIEDLNGEIDKLLTKLSCLPKKNSYSVFERSALSIDLAMIQDERNSICGPLLDIKIGIALASSVSMFAFIYPVSFKQVLTNLEEVLYQSSTQMRDTIYSKCETLLGDILDIL